MTTLCPTCISCSLQCNEEHNNSLYYIILLNRRAICAYIICVEILEVGVGPISKLYDILVG